MASAARKLPISALLHSTPPDGDLDSSKTTVVDIPVLILAKIAALVSEGPECPSAVFPFQIICDVSAWRKLNGMRESCRALRDAARLAIGALKSMTIANEDRQSAALVNELPVSSALSIPCLVHVYDVAGSGFPKLTGGLSGVKYLTLEEVCCDGSPLGNGISLKAALAASVSWRSLKVVRIFGFRAEEECGASITAFLSSLGEGLLELHLGGFFRITPTLSEDAASTVKIVTLKCCKYLLGMFTVLSSSRSLRQLQLLECNFDENARNCEGLDLFLAKSQIEELHIACTDDEYVYNSIESSIECGSLKRLHSLIWPIDYATNLVHLRNLITLLGSRTQKVKLTQWYEIDEEHRELVAAMRLPPGCELHMVVDKNGLCSHNPESGRNFLAFRNLTHLSLRRIACENFSALKKLPKLRSVYLRACKVDCEDIRALASESKSISSFKVVHCWGNDGDGADGRMCNAYAYEDFVLDLTDVRNNNMTHSKAPRSCYLDSEDEVFS